MAADLELLLPDFRDSVKELIRICEEREVIMRPIEGLRFPEKQAIYWRQSRTREEIERRIAILRNAGAPFLANVLVSVGPQHGKHVTNAIPGLSWHQWGEAVDCVWIVEGRAVWDVESRVNGVNGYLVYAEEAQRLGLNAGAFWRTFKDFPHVQLREDSSPRSVMSLQEIDAVMTTRFQQIV